MFTVFDGFYFVILLFDGSNLSFFLFQMEFYESIFKTFFFSFQIVSFIVFNFSIVELSILANLANMKLSWSLEFGGNPCLFCYTIFESGVVGSGCFGESVWFFFFNFFSYYRRKNMSGLYFFIQTEGKSLCNLSKIQIKGKL